MNYADLMTALSDACIEPRLTDEGKLVVTNSKALTEPLREALRTHKEKVIRDLKRPLMDLVVECFPGSVLDEKGRLIKYKPTPEVGVQMEMEDAAPV